MVSTWGQAATECARNGCELTFPPDIDISDTERGKDAVLSSVAERPRARGLYSDQQAKGGHMKAATDVSARVER